MIRPDRCLVAAMAIALIPLCNAPAHAFREYVPPQCSVDSKDFDHPNRYGDCLYQVMKIPPAEMMRNEGAETYRLLNITDTPAMPLFIEFTKIPRRPPR